MSQNSNHARRFFRRARINGGNRPFANRRTHRKSIRQIILRKFSGILRRARYFQTRIHAVNRFADNICFHISLARFC
jgi:hypothetical protein